MLVEFDSSERKWKSAYWLTCTKEICYFDGNGANAIFPYLFCCCQSSRLGFLSLPSLWFRTDPRFIHWNVNIKLRFMIASMTRVQCITTLHVTLYLQLTNTAYNQFQCCSVRFLIHFWVWQGFALSSTPWDLPAPPGDGVRPSAFLSSPASRPSLLYDLIIWENI